MSFLSGSAIVAFVSALPIVVGQTVNPAPGGVLNPFVISSFTGSGSVSIQAITTDAAGYVYVAGTTSAPDMTVQNGAQSTFGDGLIWRSVDRGATWQKISGWLPGTQYALTPHPTDPLTLFLSGTNGIYKTGDGGKTWRLVYSNSNGSENTVMAIDPKNPALVYEFQQGPFTAPSQFLASQDGGESWQIVGGGPTSPPFGQGDAFFPGDHFMWVDPLGSGTIGMAGSLSRDGGVTWTDMSTPQGVLGWLSFTVPDPRNAGGIYGDEGGIIGNLFSSTNWGQTWTQLVSPTSPLGAGGFEEGFKSLLPDPDTAGVLYGVDAFNVFYSTSNSGQNWQSTFNLELSGPIAALSRSCSGGALAAAGFTSLYSSTDFGITWKSDPYPSVTVASGPGCALYALQAGTSDAFVAKLAPGGKEVVWSTFLGGSTADAASTINVDGAGNVYVAGSTSSPDFPVTAPRVGVQGISNVFVTKYDPNGRVLYSVVVGGEGKDTAGVIAVDSMGDVQIEGVTSSSRLPVTVSPTPVDWSSGSTAFAIKLNPEGGVSYVSYLPSNTINSVTTELAGSALFGGYDGKLYRMAPDGSTFSVVSQLAGPIGALDSDSNGNVYVAFSVSRPAPDSECSAPPPVPPSTIYTADLMVTKLQPGLLTPVYSTTVRGQCGGVPSTIRAAENGSVTVGLTAVAGFPLLNPVLTAASPPVSTAAVLELDPNGTLLFSSFSQPLGVQVSGVAVTPVAAGSSDGSSVYVGGLGGALLSFPVAAPGGLTITGAADAFDGRSDQVSPGMLLTISGQNLADQSIDLGLDDPNPLPTQLGGVQVLFDGNPAEIVQVAPDHVICVVPQSLTQPSVSVQVVNGLTASTTPLILPVQSVVSFVGLLTQAFPALPQGSVDGVIRNSDGTLNGPANPATPGSTVTLFATGAYSDGASVQVLWDAPPIGTYPPGHYGIPGKARALTGFIDAIFIDAIYAIDLTVPGSQSSSVLTRHWIGYARSGVGIYVQ